MPSGVPFARRAYHQRSFASVYKLKRTIIDAWQKQPQSFIDNYPNLNVLLPPWTSQTTFCVSSSNLCYSIETTIVHISLLCFNCDDANLSMLMYLFYILCQGSCKSSAALTVLLIVLSHENLTSFLMRTLNDDDDDDDDKF